MSGRIFSANTMTSKASEYRRALTNGSSLLTGLLFLQLSAVVLQCFGAPVPSVGAPDFPRRCRRSSDGSVECLNAHNRYRQRHGAPALQWDSNLAAIAQRHSNSMAASGNFAHSPKRQGYGENLYFSSGRDDGSLWASAIGSWYDEARMYNYGNPCYKACTGHFTQVVWHSTTRIGCAIASSGRGTYMTCNYSPAGNMEGQYGQNVRQPGSGGNMLPSPDEQQINYGGKGMGGKGGKGGSCGCGSIPSLGNLWDRINSIHKKGMGGMKTFSSSSFFG